jgi:type IV pilus assembly protein PilB
MSDPESVDLPAVEPAVPASAPVATVPAATATVPVILDRNQLAAYLAAISAGETSDYVRGKRLDQTQWTARHDTEPDAFLRAQRFGLPLVDLSCVAPEPGIAALMRPDVARRFRAIPLLSNPTSIAVAVENPADPELLPTFNFLTELRVALLIAEPTQIRNAIAASYDRAEDAAVARQLGLDPNASGSSETAVKEAQRLASEQPVVRIVHDLIADAAQRRASDIHLRPAADGLDLLYRIDNELLPVRRFLRALAPALVSRIKVLGAMNVAEHRVPQDGRASFGAAGGHAIDLRISILPTIHGESVVIRLLDTLEGLRDIDKLGFNARDEQRFRDMMARSHGMILVTGPTGSGKSTTLYAALLEARRERVNIVTVEDPVEYHIADVQQMQVNRLAGFTFASALRNILRHDPDVIMVGEIRDHETAQIAIESALTGHLLLSTLHTNTAATTVTRLLDLGVESFLLRSTLLGVLAQRLARRNCPRCLEPEPVDLHVRELLGVGADEVFHRGGGCSHCEGLGVHGRIAVFELMPISPALRRLIVPNCSADDIHDTAVAEGMTSLTANAIALARAGTISLNEAFRLRAE